MNTGTNGDGVLLANCVGLDKSSPRIVVMEKVEMHTAQSALPADTKAAGATIDVRVVSPVLSLIVSRRPTVRLPLMLSVGTVCPDSTKRHVLEACRIKSVSRAQSRPPPLRCLPVELSEGRCTHSVPSGGHTCCTGEQSAHGVYPGLPGALLPLLQAILQQTLPACCRRFAAV